MRLTRPDLLHGRLQRPLVCVLERLPDACIVGEARNQHPQAPRGQTRPPNPKVPQVRIRSLIVRRKVGLDDIRMIADQSDEAGYSPAVLNPRALVMPSVSSFKPATLRFMVFTIRH